MPIEEKIIYQKWHIKPIGFYWLIAELGGREEEDKDIAFGYANLNDDQMAEWGSISIEELKQNGAAMDKNWQPCKFPEADEKCRKEREYMMKLLRG